MVRITRSLVEHDIFRGCLTGESLWVSSWDTSSIRENSSLIECLVSSPRIPTERQAGNIQYRGGDTVIDSHALASQTTREVSDMFYPTYGLILNLAKSLHYLSRCLRGVLDYLDNLLESCFR